MNIKAFLLSLFTFGITAAVIAKVRSNNRIEPIHAQKESYTIPKKPITVWVHGTRGDTFLPLGVSQEALVIEDHISGGPEGLHRASDIDPKYRHHTIAKTLSEADEDQFPFDSFYIFNWSGDLDGDIRLQSGQQLHAALLQDVIEPYIAQHGEYPDITILSHSHGGNVTLHMAEHAQETNQPITIKRFVPLACPVLHATEKLIHTDTFETIYPIHSHQDMVQVGDPQKFHPFKKAFGAAWHDFSIKPLTLAWRKCAGCPLFAQRHFADADNIKHVTVSWQGKAPWTQKDLKPFGKLAPLIKKWAAPIERSGRGLLHVEFIIDSFLQALPSLLHKATDGDLERVPNSIDYNASI